MNLEDVIDPEYGLQQDEWSLSKPTFGDEGQLEVVGWSGKYRSGKFYLLKCSKCGEDPELFGEGYFKSVKSNLVNGRIPCRCSKKYTYSKEQYAVVCSRKAIEIGYKFIKFSDTWEGIRTKIKMFCEKHGDWQTNTIHNLVSGGNGCPFCRTDKGIASSLKPDEEMVDSFFASGAFHPDTKFWRGEKVGSNKQKQKYYWNVFCPFCEDIYTSLAGNLQKGKRPCDCSIHRQKEAYINLIFDIDNVIAIKFGIARDSTIRVKQQDSSSMYTIKQHSAYEFPDVASCKAAERECKETLECGVVLKRDMPDGYTETTWLYNLDKIKQIYEKHGGVPV